VHCLLNIDYADEAFPEDCQILLQCFPIETASVEKVRRRFSLGINGPRSASDLAYRILSGRIFRDLKLEKKRRRADFEELDTEIGLPLTEARVYVRTDLEMIFQGIPKCGSTSMANYFALLRKPGLHRVGRIKRPRNIPLAEVAKILDYTKFTLVRNPYTRVLSAFVEKSQRPSYDCYPGLSERSPKGFSQFIEFLSEGGLHQNKHWRPMADSLFWKLEDYDYVLHLENLADEFEILINDNHLGMPLWANIGKPHWVDRLRPGKIQHSGQFVDRFYTQSTFDAVFKLYEKDFELFGYAKEFRLSNGSHL